MKRLLGGILLLFFAVFLFNASATWAEDGLPDELQGLDALSGMTQMPGRIEATGTHFEVTNSEYLNISFDSSEEVKLRLESVPQMVTMYVESASGALSTQITLSGFAPETTYHKYEDNYHNHEPFTTDVNGSYTYTQDLSVPHTVFVQTRKSTKFIRDDATGGDCYAIGIWDSPTKTCTLTTDLNETIQIDSDNIILDGNNHTLIGWNTGNGILLYQRTGVIIKKMKVSQFTNGIALYGLRYATKGNTFTDNSLTKNINGIYLEFGGNNNLTNNVLSDNSYGIYLYYNSNGNTIANNTVSNNSTYGISLDYQSNSNNVSGNTVSNNKNGIVVSWFSRGNTVTGNTADSNSSSGILVSYSGENTLSENIASNNNYGIILSGDSSYGNIVKNNTMTSNRSSNQSAGGLRSGVGLMISRVLGPGNDVFNNNFINNPVQAYCYNEICSFNHSAPEGGNYWSNYDTPAEGCNDTNGDSFCDSPYVPYSIGKAKDNLPWTKQNGWKGGNDTISPLTTISTSGTTGNNGWYVSNVEAILTASDNEGGSGVAKIEYSFDNVNWNIYTIPFTISSEGTTRIYYKSTDNAGSPESAKSQEIKIDKTPPIISATIAGTLGNNGWYLSDVTITVTATDSYSGIKEIHYIIDGVENVVSSDTAMFTLTVDGVHTIEYWAVDNAGIEGPCGSAPINRDAAAPVTMPITSGTAGSGGYYTSCVTAILQTTDTPSGTSATQYSLDGGQTWQTYAGQFEVCNTGSSDTVTVTYRSVSAAGKAEEPKILVIKIDKISPTIVANISHAPNANGWHNTDVTVTFTCNDPVPGSGVASCPSPITVATEGEGQIITGTVYDLAGNSATASVTLNIDKTAPAVNINSPFNGAEYTLGQTVTADWSANDLLSGNDVATATLPIGSVVDTSTSGAKTFSVTATDRAGNSVTRTSAYSVRYTYGGVSQPINADGSSIFRLGSTVAVRFKLTDVSGSYITSAVASIYLAKITDNVIGTEEEAVSTSAASTGNQFRYDSTDNQYIFNLSTENISAGTWQIRIELSDGSSKVAIISIR